MKQFASVAAFILWLLLTPILCFVCLLIGLANGPFIIDRPEKDIEATPQAASLSDDLTNSPLGAYSFSLVAVPKVDGLPASGYIILHAFPKTNVLPSGSLPAGMLELRSVFQNGYEVVKPFTISDHSLAARGEFTIFLDCKMTRPDLVTFHDPQIRRQK